MKKLFLLAERQILLVFFQKTFFIFWAFIKVIIYIISSISIIFGLLTLLLTGTGWNAVLQGGVLYIVTILIDSFILLISPVIKNYFSR